MKRLFKALCAAFLISSIISTVTFANECKDISNKVLRFHVLANSDSEDDQSLKIKVRDAVLEYSKELFDKADSKESTIGIAADNIDGIIATAQNEVYKNGYDYKVSGYITKMYFTTREYDAYTLPAGKYDAVRLLIGSGKGKNWWCVMFPMLCVPCAENKTELDDVLNSDEMDIVESGEKYEIKFKIVEIYQGIMSWLEKININTNNH